MFFFLWQALFYKENPIIILNPGFLKIIKVKSQYFVCDQSIM